MKIWELNPLEEKLLTLLSALHQQAVAENWVQCYLLAVRQGVAALTWEGIERLPVVFNFLWT